MQVVAYILLFALIGVTTWLLVDTIIYFVKLAKKKKKEKQEKQENTNNDKQVS